MNHFSSKSILSRMDINDDCETFILLEEYGNFDMSMLKDIFCSQNENNSFLNILNIKYESLTGIEEEKSTINNLKKYFEFIKIKNMNDNKENEINFLILKNKNLSSDDILQTINEKAIFGNEIKKTLNLNEFPIDNYILEELQNDDAYSYYDQVYFLKKGKKENINNNINNTNKNDKNEIIDRIKKLENKLSLMEENINRQLNIINSKLDLFISQNS